MRYKLFIFDLDGTLVDTSPGIMETVRQVEKRLNIPPIPEEQLRGFIGPPLEDSFQRYYGAGPEEVKRMVDLFRSRYRAEGVGNGIVYPGIPETLDAIAAAGGVSAVATLKHESVAQLALEKFGLFHRFAALAAGSDAHPSKADLIRQVMKELDWTDRSAVLMMGDSRYDGAGALEAGVDFVPLTYGFGFPDPESLSGLPAVFTAERPEDLVRFVKESLEG